MSTKNVPAKKSEEKTISERFLEKVEKEFQASLGHGVEFTDYQKKLASNLYVKIDTSLKDFEAKRLNSNKTHQAEYVWNNVNMPKLAVDAVHRVHLGLDALIPNHLHAVPYFNNKLKKYDIDLRIGYRGKDYYRRKMANPEPVDIRYELVYSTDEFEVIKKTEGQAVETYRFNITNPFQRGDVIGGFGYIMYEDESRNKVVIVSETEFKKVEGVAKASNFWSDWGDRMRYKTLVHRVTDNLDIDPEKVNPSYHYVESQENLFDESNKIPETEQPTQRRSLDTAKAEPVNNNHYAGTPFEEAEQVEEA